MFKKIEKIKANIKKAKIAAIAFGVIFVLMLLNIICLDFKVLKLKHQINQLQTK